MAEKRELQDIYTLAPLQEGMLFHALRDEGSTAYVEQMVLRLDGTIDPDRFAACWQRILDRHDCLRSVFVLKGADTPLQVVYRCRPFPFTCTDLRGRPAAEQAAVLEAYCREDRERGFDLARDVLIRGALFRLGASAWRFVLTLHHIVMDGWCQGIVYDELMTLYAAAAAETAAALPPARPYVEYIRWLKAQDREASLAFWRESLAGYSGTASVPRAPAQGSGYAYAEHRFHVDAETTRALRRRAGRAGATVSTTLQMLWGVTLCQFGYLDDVVFGSIVSGRPAELPGVDRMVGLFINAIPVRVRLDPAAGVSAFLAALQETALAGTPHHYVPLGAIQSALERRSPLFDHILVFESYPDATLAPEEQARLPMALELEGMAARTHYDFSLLVIPLDTLTFLFKYNENVHAPEQMAQLEARLRALVAAFLAADEETTLGAMMSLSVGEERAALDAARGPVVSLPEGESVVSRFEAQAAATPECLAVRARTGTFTYAALNREADSLAARLAECVGERPEARVGLLLDRDEWLPVALWAVLKAGFAYVPMEPDTPDERVNFILADSNCCCVVSSDPARDEPRVQLPVLDVRVAAGQEQPWQRPEIAAASLAYIIYTSGSTGTPKGVMIEHRNLCNFVATFADEVYAPLGSGLQTAFLANYVFDASGRAFYPPQVRGDCLVIVDRELRSDIPGLHRFLAEHQVDIVDCTPSLLSLLVDMAPEDGPTMVPRLAVTGGEALPKGLAEGFRARFAADYINVYGPTETTIDSTLYALPDSLAREAACVSIGRPLPNQSVFLVDPWGHLAPVGGRGEIWIGGAGVGRGYANRPAETEARFAPAPWGRVYRTGDIGQWRPDGCLLYHGRNDDQIKIRGHRIEVGEVESVLRALPGVRQAAVRVWTAADTAEASLIGYVVPVDTLSADRLRGALKERLPGYMIPAHLMVLEALPLNTSGKVDRRALPLPQDLEPQGGVPVPPAGPAEEKMAQLWQELLGGGAIGREDDFFACGGHSILAMRLSAAVSRAWDREVPVPLIYEAPRLGEYTARVDGSAELRPGEPLMLRLNASAGPPLFCFPPHGGLAVSCRALAETLSAWTWLGFDFAGPDSVAQYVAAIEGAVGDEPVLLVGYSGGGNLAFEVTRQLEARGRMVSGILMFDSYRRLTRGTVGAEELRGQIQEQLAEPAFQDLMADGILARTLEERAGAYAAYLMAGVDEGQVAAPITVVASPDKGEEGPVRDGRGALRSRAAWQEVTASVFTLLSGCGTHEGMLRGLALEQNAALAEQALAAFERGFGHVSTKATPLSTT